MAMAYPADIDTGGSHTEGHSTTWTLGQVPSWDPPSSSLVPKLGPTQQPVGDGQGGLACCSPWGHKELDTTELMN